MHEPRIDIAIIFKDLSIPFIIETIEKCLNINYTNYSLSLYPDTPAILKSANPKIRIIPTGKASIPFKRNVAIQNLDKKTEYLAFIDADAFPDKNWLNNALKYFATSDIVAVGGPNLTPEDEKFSRKISGYVMQQKIGFGSGAMRHKISPASFTKELPTCNLIVRASYIRENFFNEKHLIGEDTKFCSDIIQNGYKIYYAQDVIVYHHRRKIILPLLKQFYNYGHYKCKSIIDGSPFSKEYMLPSLFLLYVVVFSMFGLFFHNIIPVFLLSLACYFLICIASSARETNNIFAVFLTSAMLFLCHLSYGTGFLWYFIKNLSLNQNREGNN